MRTKHNVHTLASFPVYSAAFVSPDQVVLGGGGGATRSGIKNKLRLYRVESEKTFKLLDELELGKDEDVPMSMAAHPESQSVVCGINSSTVKMKQGENENCRMFAVKEHKLALVSTQGTLPPGNDEDYQKVTSFSPAGDFVAVAGSHDLTLFSYPSMSRAASDVHIPDAEIYDVTFSSSTLVITTTLDLRVYALPKTGKAAPSSPKKSKKGKQKEIPLVELEFLKTIQRPSLPGAESGSTYRSAKYHPGDEKFIYAVLNTSAPRTRTKSTPRRAYVCKLDTTTWEVTKQRKVGDRALTVFDVSPNGKYLAYGSSDLSIGLLDAKTLAPLLTILKSHELPPTAIRFNPTSKLLISGSADNTVRVVEVPDFSSGGWGTFILVILAIFVLLFAVATQLMLGGHLKM